MLLFLAYTQTSLSDDSAIIVFSSEPCVCLSVCQFVCISALQPCHACIDL